MLLPGLNFGVTLFLAHWYFFAIRKPYAAPVRPTRRRLELCGRHLAPLLASCLRSHGSNPGSPKPPPGFRLSKASFCLKKKNRMGGGWNPTVAIVARVDLKAQNSNGLVPETASLTQMKTGDSCLVRTTGIHTQVWPCNLQHLSFFRPACGASKRRLQAPGLRPWRSVASAILISVTPLSTWNLTKKSVLQDYLPLKGTLWWVRILGNHIHGNPQLWAQSIDGGPSLHVSPLLRFWQGSKGELRPLGLTPTLPSQRLW